MNNTLFLVHSALNIANFFETIYFEYIFFNFIHYFTFIKKYSILNCKLELRL